MFVATVNTPGYMPWDDDPPVFETTREAWDYLRDHRERGLEQAEVWDDGTADDLVSVDETLATLDSLAKGYSKNGDETGTVYGGTPGYDGDHDLGLAYSVSVAEEDDTDE